MPRISEFFGIIVYMYWMDIQKHKKPHFHVRFKGKEAVFDLAGKCLTGNIGDRANHLISEWCAENRKAIKQAWECAVHGKEIPWVRPLQ